MILFIFQERSRTFLLDILVGINEVVIGERFEENIKGFYLICLWRAKKKKAAIKGHHATTTEDMLRVFISTFAHLMKRQKQHKQLMRNIKATSPPFELEKRGKFTSCSLMPVINQTAEAGCASFALAVK